MTRLWSIRFICLIFILPSMTYATTLHAMVEMNSLTVVKPAEKGGNQIYINLFEACVNKSKKNPICTSITPQLHWQFLKENTSKKIWLWQGKLDEGDVSKIAFIVHEKGFMPFKPTELIGSMTLRLTNLNGALQSTWTVGEGTTSTVIDPTTHKFHLTANDGTYGIYDIVIKVKTD